MPELRISVPLIVKNEEHRIKDCLESLKWAYEVILVDTGSTDKTIEIAKQYPNVRVYSSWFYNHFRFRVYYFQKKKWLFCFDKARNFALNQCSGDWILIIDADERIKQPEHLTKLAETYPEIDVWYLRQVSRLNNGNTSPCKSTRFWRNGLGIHYSKMVHETVDEYVDSKGLKRGDCDIEIDHIGFLDEKFNRAKSERVIDAIEYEGHVYKNYYLAIAYTQFGNWENAINFMEKAVNDNMPFNIKAHAFAILADIYRQYGEFYFKMAEERIKASLDLTKNQNLSYIIKSSIKDFKGQNGLRELKKVKNRDYKTSEMHQDILLTDGQLDAMFKEYNEKAVRPKAA